MQKRMVTATTSFLAATLLFAGSGFGWVMAPRPIQLPGRDFLPGRSARNHQRPDGGRTWHAPVPPRELPEHFRRLERVNPPYPLPVPLS